MQWRLGQVSKGKSKGKGKGESKDKDIVGFKCGGQAHVAPQRPSTEYREKGKSKGKYSKG